MTAPSVDELVAPCETVDVFPPVAAVQSVARVAPALDWDLSAGQGVQAGEPATAL
jgi:hypothetical protein